MAALEVAVGTWEGDGAWIGYLYGILPVSLAISLPYVSLREDFRRRAIGLAGLVFVLMLALDVGEPGTTDVVEATSPTDIAEPAALVPAHPDFARYSGTRTLITQARGRFPGIERDAVWYPPGHPRTDLAFALFKLSFLMIPLAMALAISWSVGWIEREIPAPVARVRARFFSCWVLGTGMYALAFSWAERALTAAMFGDGSLVTILLPSLAVLVAALLLSRRAPVRSPEVVKTR